MPTTTTSDLILGELQRHVTKSAQRADKARTRMAAALAEPGTISSNTHRELVEAEAENAYWRDLQDRTQRRMPVGPGAAIDAARTIAARIQEDLLDGNMPVRYDDPVHNALSAAMHHAAIRVRKQLVGALTLGDGADQ
ncbi:hypothetical protein [Streptacidiphilus cavernicola]|uniref:Uncharacterized protein n=1 Tax=Streptacidiphilus cavernicola TaxID=3342716 RepID=A0ABV6VY83_9ACTN